MKATLFKRLSVVILLVMAFAAVQIIAQDDDEDLPDANTLFAERGLEALPLEVVTESGEQILDLTATSARLNFIGTIPLACTVVFGTDTDFGNASIDQDMGGATIIEHNPLLLDLEPDTEYFYRVQGSAEDGTFYVGEIRSFRTPPESDEADPNLLAPSNGAEVTGVSSNFGGAANDERWGILNAFDGNLNTAWSSDGDGDDAWFEVTLPEPQRITGIEVQTRLMSDGTSQVFSFTVTADGETVHGPFELPEQQQVVTFDVDFVATTLRIDVESSSGGNTGFDEFALFGEAVE